MLHMPSIFLIKQEETVCINDKNLQESAVYQVEASAQLC